MTTKDPYIEKLKREALKPVMYNPGISPETYFRIIDRLETEIEVRRLRSYDDPKFLDGLFMNLVRYVGLIKVLSKMKHTSQQTLNNYTRKMDNAQTFITEAEMIKSKISERLIEDRIRLAEEIARRPPPPPPPEPEPDLPTPSFPSAPPPEPTRPETPEPNVVTNKEDRIYLIPHDLEKRFMQAAWANTQKGIETCGVMVGEFNGPEITIDGVLLPPQRGDYNTCQATDETAISEWQISNSKVSVGWIHTHPTQDCFLSSIDLHMHFSYQSLQPEALAIVCAPTDRKIPCGKFRITDYGMEYLKNCTRGQGFHAHEDAIAPLFEQAPFKLLPKMSVNLVDFRT